MSQLDLRAHQQQDAAKAVRLDEVHHPRLQAAGEARDHAAAPTLLLLQLQACGVCIRGPDPAYAARSSV